VDQYLDPVIRFLEENQVEQRFDRLIDDRSRKDPLRDDVTLLGLQVRQNPNSAET
jgi:hypothetical protein